MKYNVPDSSSRAAFGVFWDITSKTDLLGFTVRVCSSTIQENRTLCEDNVNIPKADSTFTFSAPFYSNLKVWVVATFNAQNPTREIRKPSAAVKGVSGVGAPGKIEVVHRKFGPESLTVFWQLPATSNGPIDHYLLKVIDTHDAENQRV